jgi:hypothetical protein
VTADLQQKLNGKRILVIGSKLFGYEERIICRLTELGAEAFFIDQRLDNTAVSKIVIRTFPLLFRVKVNSYFNEKLKAIPKIDKIFVISPESLSLKILQNIKKITNAEECILYMWDSFSNKKHAEKLMPCFNKILTFDPDDARKKSIYFRPLFYSSGKDNMDKKKKNMDISFVGTGHSDRAKIISLIKEQCNKLDRTCFFYLYLQNSFVYYYNKITNKDFKKIKKSAFHFLPLNYNEYERISESSKVVIDIEHPAQKGLTIRTFEILGKETKLMTTNKLIKGYDFYNDTNILVIDRLNPVVDIKFLDKDFQPLSPELCYKYSIDGWLEDIFFSKPQIL